MKMIPAATLCRLALHNADAPLSIRGLIAAGEIAGHNENAVRVACARLKQQGLVEATSRGVYALTEKASILDDFAKRWTLGEERKRPHHGDFITVFFEDTINRRERNLRIRALNVLGFRNAQGTWVRPNNLTLSHDKMTLIANEAFSSQKTPGNPRLYLARTNPPAALAKLWRAAFDIEILLEQYQGLTHALEGASKRSQTQPPGAHLLNATLLGERAIQALVNDPLLPEEWLSSTERERLFTLTKTHVEKTRAEWQRSVPELSFPDVASRNQSPVAKPAQKKTHVPFTEGTL